MLVCPAVFKTVAGGEELPRWVRFPHTLANGNRSGRAAPVFVHFNPSVKPSVCQLPGRGAFWHCASTTQKLSPFTGKVARSAERGAAQRWLRVQRAAGGVASRLLLFTPTPQPNLRFASSPAGEPFGYRPPRMHAPDIPQIIAYMLKLTSISCFSIVMPIYIDNLMIIGYLITIRRGLCMKEINSFG